MIPTAIDNGQLYLFNDADGETRIKRLHRLGTRTLALVSDNPDHSPEIRNGIDAERLKVLGRIVWSGHNW
ncbi:S24 family peptidase [Pararhodobacter sp.]|uniref:S24 family peptidase n=1 Tax=Pararhodobacter sp. TaxID=2127056 RepID=UPI002AFE34CA|nr:S24 family peptidase [Pararhodobacter sp.]